MKRIIFALFCTIMLSAQAADWQSSWYKPTHQQQQTQQRSNQSNGYSSWYNPNAPRPNTNNGAVTMEQYSRTFNDGATFSGHVEKVGGSVLRYRGSIKYPNGDIAIGAWNPSWAPVSDHESYRASDHTRWKF